jgi:hypothetical protein
MKCGYCGNGSGKTDARGNCVSCGATLDKPEPASGSWVERESYTYSTDAYYDFSFNEERFKQNYLIQTGHSYERRPQEELDAEDKYYKSLARAEKYSVRWFLEAVFGDK